MRKKPFIFTLISILCLVEPLIKVLYFKAITHFDFAVIVSNLSARASFFEVVDFWLVFPIAGLFILKLRKFNYFAFLAIQAYIIYSIVTYEEYTWPYNSDSPFFYNYALTVFSIMSFLYFLLPGTRKPFFDARVRWWEPMVRFNVAIKCQLINARGNWSSTIRNISKSGVFIEGGHELEVGDKLIMEFIAFGETHSLILEVMNKHAMDERKGFGARFHFDSLSQVFRLRSVVNKIGASQEMPGKNAIAA